MEKLWDIKSFRNNLLSISLINLLILLFSKNISEINVLGLIKISDIYSLKFFMVLIVVNLYMYRRYLQYLLKSDKEYNYVLLFKDILDSWFYTSTKNQSNQAINMSISKTWSILLNGNPTAFKNISNIEDVTTDIEILEWGKVEQMSLSARSISNTAVYKVVYENNLRIIYLKFLFYLKEKYFFDYYLPVWLGFISLVCLTIKILCISYVKYWFILLLICLWLSICLIVCIWIFKYSTSCKNLFKKQIRKIKEIWRIIIK